MLRVDALYGQRDYDVEIYRQKFYFFYDFNELRRWDREFLSSLSATIGRFSIRHLADVDCRRAPLHIHVIQILKLKFAENILCATNECV